MVADIVKKLTYVLVEKWVSVDSIWLIKWVLSTEN
jgi:hypothetical protein